MRWWWASLAAALMLPPVAVAQPGPADPAPAAADDEDEEDDRAGTDRGGMAGERTLVDTLDEDKPLELGDQLRIFRQARRRRGEIERMEGMLNRRARRLQTVQQEIENRYKTLRMLQEEIVAVAGEAGQDAQQEAAQNTQDEARKVDQVRKLGKVVDKMKAPDAAKMLEAMNEPLVVDVMLIIKPKQAAKILGQMEPKLAARIGEEMSRLKEQRRRRR